MSQKDYPNPNMGPNPPLCKILVRNIFLLVPFQGLFLALTLSDFVWCETGLAANVQRSANVWWKSSACSANVQMFVGNVQHGANGK